MSEIFYFGKVLNLKTQYIFHATFNPFSDGIENTLFLILGFIELIFEYRYDIYKFKSFNNNRIWFHLYYFFINETKHYSVKIKFGNDFQTLAKQLKYFNHKIQNCISFKKKKKLKGIKEFKNILLITV